MKKPLIKPSHRGLLHEDLGVPKGQKIGRTKLEAAKKSADPAIRKRATFALNMNGKRSPTDDRDDYDAMKRSVLKYRDSDDVGDHEFR